MKQAVRLVVNGQAHAGAAEPRTSLADFLRDDLDLTGTHVGCEHGVCGACTVLLEGEPVRACLMLAVQAEGRSVMTIEGLAATGSGRLTGGDSSRAGADSSQAGADPAGQGPSTSFIQSSRHSWINMGCSVAFALRYRPHRRGLPPRHPVAEH